jgi:hypothetical protein
VVERVAELNRRYWEGSSGSCAQKGGESNAAKLRESGVLLRQFDRINDEGALWMPCPNTPSSWCRDLSDRWASSIINSQLNHLYFQDGTGGIILSPDVQLFCAYPGGATRAAPTNAICSSGARSHFPRVYLTHIAVSCVILL